MPYPTGATTVVYSVSQYDEGDGNPEINTTIRFSLQGNPASALDGAAQAAMDAYVAHLEGLNPGVTVSAARVYECSQAGDAWPTA